MLVYLNGLPNRSTISLRAHLVGIYVPNISISTAWIHSPAHASILRMHIKDPVLFLISSSLTPSLREATTSLSLHQFWVRIYWDQVPYNANTDKITYQHTGSDCNDFPPLNTVPPFLIVFPNHSSILILLFDHLILTVLFLSATSTHYPLPVCLVLEYTQTILS